MKSKKCAMSSQFLATSTYSSCNFRTATHRSDSASSFVLPQSLRHVSVSAVNASGSKKKNAAIPTKKTSIHEKIRDLSKLDDMRAHVANCMALSRANIWEVKDGAQTLTDLTDVSEFLPDRSYVILTNSVDRTSGNVVSNTYYWVGKESVHTDAAEAAFQAITLDAKIHPVVQVRREVEGEESYDFLGLFKPRKEPSSIVEVPTELDYNRKRMFLIEGEDQPTVREVELSSVHVLGNASQCLVFVSNKVYAACRTGATERHKKSARELVAILMKRKNLKVGEIKVHKIETLFLELSNEEAEDLRQFFAEFGKVPADIARQQIANNPEIFNLEEERRITDQTSFSEDGSEFFRIVVTRIYEKGYNDVAEEKDTYARLPIVLMNTKDCYIMDTRSNLGLIVWMGKNSEISLRRECARRAEIYSMENGYDYTTPIIFVDQRGIPKDLVLADVQALVHIVHLSGFENEHSTDEEEDEQSKLDDSATIPLDVPISMLWKVKEGGLERITDGIALESHKCYVLFQNSMEETSKTEHSRAKIFYWVGKNSSDTDAADAASHAIVLDYRVHQTPLIHREAQGQESLEFRTLFKQFFPNTDFSIGKEEQAEVTFGAKSSRSVNVDKKRMFSIEGDHQRLSFKELELSFTNVLGSDRNCLVFSSEKVHVACGSLAHPKLMKGAKELAKILMERKDLKVEKVIKVHQIDKLFSSELPEEDAADLRAFFAQFDRIPKEEAKQQIADDPEKFEPKEMRRILDQTIPQVDGKEWFNVKVFRIFHEFSQAVAEEYWRTFGLIPIENLQPEECYLIDSQSTVGLFLWVGKESGLALRKASAKKIELYLRSQKYSNTTFITYLGQEEVPFDTLSVQSMVHVMNPEMKDKRSQLIVEAEPPVITDELGCPNCPTLGMCADCPKRKARIEASLSPQAKRFKDRHPPQVSVESSIIDVENVFTAAASSGLVSSHEKSSSVEIGISDSVVERPETGDSVVPDDIARASKLSPQRAAANATKSDKVRSALEPLRETIKRQSETLKNALNFTQILQLLENNSRKNVSAKGRALKPLEPLTINHETIIKQLDEIYENVKDRDVKKQITKLKDKINKDFLNGAHQRNSSGVSPVREVS